MDPGPYGVVIVDHHRAPSSSPTLKNPEADTIPGAQPSKILKRTTHPEPNPQKSLSGPQFRSPTQGFPYRITIWDSHKGIPDGNPTWDVASHVGIPHGNPVWKGVPGWDSNNGVRLRIFEGWAPELVSA